MTWVVRLIVLVPALAGLLGLLTRRSTDLARGLAVGSAVAVTGLAFAQWVAPAGRSDLDSLGALDSGQLEVPLHLLSDPLSGLVAFAVALVVLAIQVFTVWYLADDPRYAQFAATVSLFAAGMLLVVQAGDLVLLLVGWEVMGWCSWLLIGHDTERAAARRAAYKAFLVTRTADIAMVVGLIALSVRAGTTDLAAVLAQPEAVPLGTLGLVGVAIGVAGKSGLIPFHDWLPDAMEGPTPASALIHAATMVAAGSYVVARLFPLYAADDVARTLLAVLAALTMLYAAGLALAQSDLKRLLAYSTLSQVAIMVGALAAAPAAAGRSAVGPGMGHLVAHAFFKALLFLAAGWLAVLVGGTALRLMRGRLRRLGAPRSAIFVGLAALAGIPPLVGFFSKDTVVASALDGAREGGGFRSWVVVAALLLTVALTAAYCARAWLLLDRRAAAPSVPHSGHRPITSAASLSVFGLAVLSLLGTLLLTTLDGAVHVGLASVLLSLALVAVGLAAAWVLSRRGTRDAADALPARLRESAIRGFGADTAYARLGGAVTALARLVVVLDRDVVDAYPRAAAAVTRSAGRLGDRTHRAVPSLSLLGLVAGVVIVAAVGVAAWS